MELNDPIWLWTLSGMSSTARRGKFRTRELQAQFILLGSEESFFPNATAVAFCMTLLPPRRTILQSSPRRAISQYSAACRQHETH